MLELIHRYVTVIQFRAYSTPNVEWRTISGKSWNTQDGGEWYAEKMRRELPAYEWRAVSESVFVISDDE